MVIFEPAQSFLPSQLQFWPERRRKQGKVGLLTCNAEDIVSDIV